MRIMALPPTDNNLLFHTKRAHHQMILWKAADKQSPPKVDINQHGWKVKDGIPVPVFAADHPAPPGLTDVLSCGCKSDGKACSSRTCTCHKNQLSCTLHCMCGGTEGCCNPFLMRSDDLNENDDSDNGDEDD